MVNSFFAILGFVLFCVVVAMFLSWCIAAKRVRYDDWARQERRKHLLEVVREVRLEKGDYVAARSGIPKSKKATSVGSAPRRAVRRKG